MDIIEYRGFKNIFIGLCQQHDKYYIMYGKTENPSLIISEENSEVLGLNGTKLLDFCTSKNINLYIPFCSKKNKYYTLIEISNKNEYYNIVTILEDLLYE